jgi:hypothetical protein
MNNGDWFGVALRLLIGCGGRTFVLGEGRIGPDVLKNWGVAPYVTRKVVNENHHLNIGSHVAQIRPNSVDTRGKRPFWRIENKGDSGCLAIAFGDDWF